MRPQTALAAFFLVSFFVARGCTEDCPYAGRCEGNNLEYCSVGVDQCLGPRGFGSEPCPVLNPTCVETSEVDALCAISADATCEQDECEGDTLLLCEQGFQVAVPCDSGNVCVLRSDRIGLCAVSADAACENVSGAADVCLGTARANCQGPDGLSLLVFIEDCAEIGLQCVLDQNGFSDCE